MLFERVPWRKLSDDLNEPKNNFNEFIKVNRPNEPTESDFPMPFKTYLLKTLACYWKSYDIMLHKSVSNVATFSYLLPNTRTHHKREVGQGTLQHINPIKPSTTLRWIIPSSLTAIISSVFIAML